MGTSDQIIAMRFTFLLLFTIASLTIDAQEIPVPVKANNILDSLNTLASKQWLTDTLSVKSWGDSFRSGIESKTTDKINSIHSRIDSLKTLQLPTDK